MRSNLFWLSDEQWGSIQPLLPMDVRGKARVDDRRVISGIVFVIKSGCRWWIVRRNMAQRRRSTIGLFAGRNAECGSDCSVRLQGAAGPRRCR